MLYIPRNSKVGRQQVQHVKFQFCFNERLLCIIALVLLFVPLPAIMFISDVTSLFTDETPKDFYNVTYSLLTLCPLAGIVLMIIARVKYPQSRFAKVVMWIFICISLKQVVPLFIISRIARFAPQ